MLDLAGKRVTVMGLGRFGGGIGVCRYLAGLGADVLVTDLAAAEELIDSIEQVGPLIDRGLLRLRLGEHNVSDFTTADLVVANPAVPKPWENRYLRSAAAAGVPITTEIGLLIDGLPGAGRTRTIGITGSVGKSTTTAMIHHALSAVAPAVESGTRVHVGGNLGGSLLSEVSAGTIGPRDWVVLELSSAMLYWLSVTDRACGAGPRRAAGVSLTSHTEALRPDWGPRVSVVTNIAPNHLDWHGTMEHYTACKRTLISGQRSGDECVLGASVRAWGAGAPVRAGVVDGSVLPEEATLSVPGRHNRVNAATALRAVEAALRMEGVDPSRGRIIEALRGFGGLEHRLRLVGVARGVRYYNDSKSTTPESALRAIDAVSEQPGVGIGRVHLIAGGYDKKIDLSSIAQRMLGGAGLYTIGATGDMLAELARSGGMASERVHQCCTLAAAFAACAGRAGEGEAVVLSPGCASWDQYVNFEARGEEFVRLVRGLA